MVKKPEHLGEVPPIRQEWVDRVIDWEWERRFREQVQDQALSVSTTSYNLEKLVDGMVSMGEAMALAIEVFDHHSDVQIMQARRALEHAVRKLEEARIR